jgi:hypothetical protein
MLFLVIRMPVTRLATRKAMPHAPRNSTTSVSATNRKAPHSPPGAPAAYRPYAYAKHRTNMMSATTTPPNPASAADTPTRRASIRNSLLARLIS